ncbi:MAG: type VI secretion system accessory protein TagJ, partial [Planctomycetia bacterium]
ALFRQLLRAEEARRQCFNDGRAPEFFGLPTEDLKRRLEALVHRRAGEHDAARRLLDEAEAARPHPAGTVDGVPFDDLRDLDDYTASFLEVLTTNGKYYWFPFESLKEIEFREPAWPRDLCWRSARVVLKDDAECEVYLPALYVESAGDPDEALRLGRTTDWRGGPDGPIHGVGQRILLAGETDVPFLSLHEIKFAAS